MKRNGLWGLVAGIAAAGLWGEASSTLHYRDPLALTAADFGLRSTGGFAPLHRSPGTRARRRWKRARASGLK